MRKREIFDFVLQAISKIVDNAQEQGKSRRKSAAYIKYVSILRRILTQLLSVRCIFEMACSLTPEAQFTISRRKNIHFEGGVFSNP